MAKKKIDKRVVAAIKKTFPKAKTRKKKTAAQAAAPTEVLLNKIYGVLLSIQAELKRLNDQVAFEPGKLDPEVRGGGDTGVETHSGD